MSGLRSQICEWKIGEKKLQTQRMLTTIPEAAQKSLVNFKINATKRKDTKTEFFCTKGHMHESLD
jgi:hypothetical protein